MDKIYETTNQLIELSVQMNGRGATIAANATEKMATKIASRQTIPSNVLAVMDMIEITEHALKQVQAQRKQVKDVLLKNELVHKEATIKAILKRIEESVENY